MSSSSLSSPEMEPAMGPDIRPDFSYKNATHDEVLEDLSSRFILNLPDEELSSLERISFQVEQAHWFYEDFIREQNTKLPSLSLKKFSAMLFNACPLLHHWSHDHEQAFNTFMQYKTRVPVCGAIMLNDTWEKCVLVKGWKASSGWGFPKGKINQQEPPSTCAVREVLEETGYNLAGKINPEHVIEMTIKEQRIAMFIVPNVPEDYQFETKTRKEISKIEWFRLNDLPTWRRNHASPGKFYLISPFIAPLKNFIQTNKPHNGRRHKKKNTPFFESAPITEADEPGQDSTQESSSQTSSADNGGPPTPSPQSSEANRVVLEDTDMAGIDPHFARLLSSLTSSTSIDHNLKEPVVLTDTPTPETSPESQPAVQAAPPTVTSPQSTFGSMSSQSTITSRTRPRSQADPPEATVVPLERPQASIAPSKADSVLSPSSSPPSVVSPRSASSRRTSSVADISPYLRRQVAPQTTPVHLKRLALLEGIANESARMTPRLEEEEKRYSSSNGFRTFNQDFTFPPPAQAEHNLLYSSTAPGRQAVAGAPSALHDPFLVRSRTSLATHRPLSAYNSASMASSELVSVMQMQTSHLPPPPLPPFSMPHYGGMHPPHMQHGYPAPLPHMHYPGSGMHVGMMPPPGPPSVASPVASGALAQGNRAVGTLLSILNARNTPVPSNAP